MKHVFLQKRVRSYIGHSNRDHATPTKKGRLERFKTKADLDRLLNKALQALSLGGGCVIPITVPYCLSSKKREFMRQQILQGFS